MPRRFKPYAVYADSGSDRIGNVPLGWQAVKLKRVCAFAYGESLTSESRVYGEVDVYGSNGAVGSHEQANTLAPCLVIGRKGSFGKVNYSDKAVFAIDTTFFVDSRFTQADLRWLYYALSHARLDSATKDSAIPGLDREDAYARDLCLCSKPEQRAIAAFLDAETARIDDLVAKKEQLIALLLEHRAALIAGAVTKGLDPNVPMKDSGVEWLGEIPKHWEVMKTTWLFSIGSGTTPKSEEAGYYGGETPWITTSELRESVITSTEKSVTSDALREHSSLKVHPKGSVAVAMYGATIGRLGILGVAATVNQACCVFSRPKGIEAQFWYYWLQMRRSYLISLGYGGGQPNLSQDLLRSVRVPTPPVPEQREIIASLDRETARINALVVKVRDAIERLKELRSALISATVTGRIDVREGAA
jgi:type I restriction enzyme S subunit